MLKSTIHNTQDALEFQRQSKHKQPGETYSGLGNAYGNQALLKMKRATRISPVTPLRPSQTLGLQRKCAECEEEDKLQRKPNGNADYASSASIPPIVHEVLSSSGQSLDVETLEFMEPRLGQDLSQVRVHTDSKAAESASAVNALAYTVGSHVVFNNAQYQPNSPNGRKLLAHELTHTIQQSGNNTYSTNSLVVGKSDGPFESIANSISESIEGGFTIGNSIAVEKTPNASGTIQRVAGVDDAAEAVTLGAALAWCVSGALVTVAIDEVIQLAKWAWNRGKFKQNMCATLFSALYGCVFGIAGGAFEKMFLSEGVAITGSNIAKWIIKKLLVFGFTQLAGKISLSLAKYGCAEAQNNSVAMLDDGGNSNQDVTNQGQDNTTSSDTSSAVA